MKRLKHIILIALCLLCIIKVNAQQAPYYTQYTFNDYLVNPAVAGTFNFFQIRANQRVQWMKIDRAPRTMSIAGYGPFKNRDMGYGGYIYNDVTGPESRLSLGGSYAYNILLTGDWRISGGLTVGIMQYKLDGTQMYIDEEGENDPAMPQGVESRIIPDASIGFYAYTSYYYVGLSAHQLLGNKYATNEVDSAQGISRLTQHVYLSGGANFILNRDFLLTPSVLVKYSMPNIVQFELNVMATYQRMVWAGLTYRTGHSLAIMAGYNYENKIIIGLAYDYPISDIRRYTSGTIEVMIGYKFNKIK